MRALKEEISVEDYLRFFHSQKRFDFTVNFLNQVALSLLIFTLNFFAKSSIHDGFHSLFADHCHPRV